MYRDNSNNTEYQTESTIIKDRKGRKALKPSKTNKIKIRTKTKTQRQNQEQNKKKQKNRNQKEKKTKTQLDQFSLQNLSNSRH